MANLYYIMNGGAEGDRTPDLMTASHKFSQRKSLNSNIIWLLDFGRVVSSVV